MGNIISNKIKFILKWMFGDFGNRIIYYIVYLKNKKTFIKKSKEYNRNKLIILNRLSKKDSINILFLLIIWECGSIMD